MTVSQNNFNCAQKLSIMDMTRSVSFMFCLHRNNCIYTVCMKLVKNVGNYIIQMHF